MISSAKWNILEFTLNSAQPNISIGQPYFLKNPAKESAIGGSGAEPQTPPSPDANAFGGI